MSDDIPTTWATCEIGDVTDVVGGATPPAKDSTNFSEKGGVPWITPADLSGYKDVYIARGRRNLSEKGFAACSAAMMPAGTVLFSSRAPVGYVAVAANPVCTNQGFKSFVLPPDLDSRYLYYYLRHIRPEAEARATGTTFKELSGKAAKKLPLVVAPLNEQRRIADKLDAALARVEACRERLDRVPTILEGFRQSVLGDAISGELTRDIRDGIVCERSGHDLLKQVRLEHKNFEAFDATQERTKVRKTKYKAPKPVDSVWSDELPGSWAWASGAELVVPGDEIVYGIVQPGAKLDAGVPYVRGTDIQDGEILVDQLLFTSQEIADRYARASLRGGDVLLGIIRATKVAIVPDALEGANITQGTARFRPSRAISTDYLAIALEAPQTQRWLHDHYRGIDMPGLNLADVRRVPIPLPPIEEQSRIASCVGSLLEASKEIAERHALALERVQSLTPSLLSKAFRGELVPQDPADEDASSLLDRIRVARAETETKPKRAKAPRRKKMAKLTAESLKAIVSDMPGDSFTFDELRARASADYESLKDAVFSLLADADVGLRQSFDSEASEMRFIRVKP